MSKLKIKLKLQGLELEVEGERADIPAITHGLQKQIGGLPPSSQSEPVAEAQVASDNGDGKKGRNPKAFEVGSSAGSLLRRVAKSASLQPRLSWLKTLHRQAAPPAISKQPAGSIENE